MEYSIGKRCEGCRITCAILAAERESCPCSECLVKVMCTRMCKERYEYYTALSNRAPNVK